MSTSGAHPRLRRIGLVLLALIFVLGGIGHFVRPEEYARIIPPILPWPRMLVFVSGVCEVLGGLGMLYRLTRRVAAWGLVVLLIAVFPANLYMAMHGIDGPQWALWARLPLQIPLIWWAWTYTRRD